MRRNLTCLLALVLAVALYLIVRERVGHWPPFDRRQDPRWWQAQYGKRLNVPRRGPLVDIRVVPALAPASR